MTGLRTFDTEHQAEQWALAESTIAPYPLHVIRAGWVTNTRYYVADDGKLANLRATHGDNRVTVLTTIKPNPANVVRAAQRALDAAEEAVRAAQRARADAMKAAHDSGMSQADIAETVGITGQAVSQIIARARAWKVAP